MQIRNSSVAAEIAATLEIRTDVIPVRGERPNPCAIGLDVLARSGANALTPEISGSIFCRSGANALTPEIDVLPVVDRDIDRTYLYTDPMQGTPALVF
ncbi:unnamed protein product [Dibothriocephalus latus]|uniref:Uncharacterized protein n=1 Tax=Dibothriocephalus latus TaxID=60516 RepID=A0A3P7M187_DIBLA|nr:unnamed protein product [Dibothriocephalus latus]